MAEREDAEVCGVGFPACPSVAIGSTGDMRWTRGVGLRRGYEVYMARCDGAMDACALPCSGPASGWKPELRGRGRYARECYAVRRERWPSTGRGCGCVGIGPSPAGGIAEANHEE